MKDVGLAVTSIPGIPCAALIAQVIHSGLELLSQIEHLAVRDWNLKASFCLKMRRTNGKVKNPLQSGKSSTVDDL